MFKMCMRNMVSKNRPTESLKEMGEHDLLMPFVESGCDRCGDCARACSAGAITVNSEWSIDVGKCIFCYDCMDSCEKGAMKKVSTPLYSLTREGLIFKEGTPPAPASETLGNELTDVMGRSIAIRELDTGSCNLCEIEVNNASNPYYDMARFGIKISASPRHADVLLTTGPMAENMRVASIMTYEATPNPKAVIAMGTCAISGGLFVTGDVHGEGIQSTLDVDAYIPGCPPSPDRLTLALIKMFGMDAVKNKN